MKGYYNYNKKFHPYATSFGLITAEDQPVKAAPLHVAHAQARMHEAPNVYYNLFCQDSNLFFSNGKTTLLPNKKVTHSTTIKEQRTQGT